MSFLPSFGSDVPSIDWLLDNQGAPAFFIVLFVVIVAISGKTMRAAAEDFMKARPVLAIACLLAGILLYLNLLWLPPFLCVATVIVLFVLPSPRRWRARWTFAAAFAAYLAGYPLQSFADHFVHRLTWGAGPGLILLPQPDNPMLSATESNLNDVFNLYSQLRSGLTGSFQSVDALHIVPEKDPDQESFRSTYATALRPERLERLSRMFALSGQSIDIIIETDFVDAVACGARRWRVSIRPKIWRKNAWRPWSTGQIDPDPGWLLDVHPDMVALDDERPVLGLMVAYELGRYLEAGKTVRLDNAHAMRFWGNLADQFSKFAWRIRDAHPLPKPLDQAIEQLERSDPTNMAATLKNVVSLFQTMSPPSEAANCAEVANREQNTALSALGRQ